MRNDNNNGGSSTLGRLRALIPIRRCEFAEALRIAELQAARLLELSGVDDAPIPIEIISEQPHIQLHRRTIPMSGLSYWNGVTWIIVLNAAEPWTRQRFTLLHEYKHIIDHGRASLLYSGRNGRDTDQKAEQAADFFAGCVLVPGWLLKRAWASGMQTPSRLAQHFQTSERAMIVRLTQVGLIDRTGRHGGRTTYLRSTPTHCCCQAVDGGAA